MDEARLDDLIRKLHNLPLDEPETKDCPPFAQLWACVSSGRSLGPAERHVEQCPRCRRLLDIMRRELAAVEAEAVAARPIRFPRRAAAVLAATACIAIVVVVGWPTGPSQHHMFAMVSTHCAPVYLHGTEPVTRGPGDEVSPPMTTESDFAEFLSAVQDAKTQHFGVRLGLGRAWAAGQITSDERGYLILTAAGKAQGSHERGRLERWVGQENEARNKIVEAVQAHVPDLKGVSKDDIRRALDRWLAENVLGDSSPR